MVRMPLFLALVIAVTPASSEEPLAPATDPAPEVTALPGPRLVAATIARADVDDQDRRARAELGWARAQLELALSRLPGVVPTIEGSEPPPGLAASMEPEATWQVTFQVQGPRATLEVCQASCEHWTTAWDAEHPEATIDTLVASLALAQALPYTAGQLEGPADPYIRTIASRASAVFQGLEAPPQRRGDVRTDPIARSVYLDSSQAVVQWQAARAGLHTPREVLGLLQRGAADHDDPVFHAAEAWALAQAGASKQAAEKWLRVMELAPDDRRFALQAARAAIRVGDRATAEHCITLLGGGNADVARLRVELADVAGGADDALLEAWQELDPSDPAPVQRRIDARIAAGDLRAARSLLPALAERGEQQRSEALALAIQANLESSEPTFEGPTLVTLDERLSTLQLEVEAALTRAETLARVQNRWSSEHRQLRYQCPADALDLRDQARALGTALRGEVLAARASLDEVHRLLEASTIEPVLDPERRAIAESLRVGVQRAGHAFVAAVQVQQEQVEWRSRRCG